MKLLFTIMVSLLVVAQVEAGPKTKKQTRKTASSDIAAVSTEVIVDSGFDHSRLNGIYYASDECGNQNAGLIYIGMNQELAETQATTQELTNAEGTGSKNVTFDYVYLRKKENRSKVDFRPGRITFHDLKETTTIVKQGVDRASMEVISDNSVLSARIAMVNGELANTESDDGSLEVKELSTTGFRLYDNERCDEKVRVTRQLPNAFRTVTSIDVFRDRAIAAQND